MNKVVKALVLKTNCLGLITILLFFIFIVGCSKDDGVAYPPFTADQLGWINNLENPKYRCVAKTTDTQGNVITAIDTVEAHTNTTNYLLSGDNTTYYQGSFYFTLWYSLNIEINNASDFIAKLSLNIYYYDITHYNTDTAMINGNLYHDVYKFSNLVPQIYFKKLYFKKNIGFIYVESLNGNYATIIQ